MAKKPTITTVSSGYQGTATINDNFQKLRDAFDNTLSRDGSTPNFMDADLDMNGNDIINVGSVNGNAILTVTTGDARYVNVTGDTMTGSLTTPSLYTNGLYINGNPVLPSTLTYNGIVKEFQVATSGQTVFTLTGISYTPGINNLSVYVDGVYQKPSNYTETSSTVVTFSVGLHVGAIVDFVVLGINSLGGTADAVNLTYTAPGTGTVSQTIYSKLSEVISVKDFGAVGDGVANDGPALQLAFQHAALTGLALSFVGGKTYLCDLNTISVTLQENKSLTLYGNNALLKQRTANTSVGGNPALITVTSASALSTTTTVSIHNLNFDGSIQPVDWAGSSVGTGSNAVKLSDIAVVSMDGCKANKFWFSSVFQFLKCRYVNVVNCYMKEVGGHTLLDDAGSANGDALQFYNIPNGAAYHVSNCTFIGYPTSPYQGGYPHNLSRAGVVFELGNGTTPSFKATVDNCYFDGFSIVVHVELAAYADISVSNVVAKNGWALIGGFGSLFKVRVDNCSWDPLVSGNYNGINGFTMTDVGATSYTIDVYNSYYRPVSANRLDGTFYGCTFDNFDRNYFKAGGTTKAFYDCTFNGVVGGPGADYLFFGDSYQIFDACTFNGALPGSGIDFKLSFTSRGTSPLRITNCVFNDCGLYVDGGSGTVFVLDGCQFKYTAPITSLTILNYGGTVNGYIRNSQFYASGTSSGTKLNSSVVGTVHELSNCYVKNATVYTAYAQPFTMLGSTIEFDSTATPTAEGFFGRFSDYVIVSACTFVQPTATAITLATPNLRNSSVLKTSGTVAALANI
jgi:hypothetical protein